MQKNMVAYNKMITEIYHHIWHEYFINGTGHGLTVNKIERLVSNTDITAALQQLADADIIYCAHGEWMWTGTELNQINLQSQQENKLMNNLSTLNDHLFNQIERLNKPLNADEMKLEIERSRAINGVANNIINNARLALDAHTKVESKDTPALLK